jgi:hypothetical protein
MGASALDYRLYLHDPNGHIRTVEELSCANDDEAITAAEPFVTDEGEELWQLARRVACSAPIGILPCRSTRRNAISNQGAS